MAKPVFEKQPILRISRYVQVKGKLFRDTKTGHLISQKKMVGNMNRRYGQLQYWKKVHSSKASHERAETGYSYKFIRKGYANWHESRKYLSPEERKQMWQNVYWRALFPDEKSE